MKEITFEYETEKRTKSVAIETAHDAHETVYIVYENGAYTFMTGSLFSLLQFVRNQYDEYAFNCTKSRFQ